MAGFMVGVTTIYKAKACARSCSEPQNKIQNDDVDVLMRVRHRKFQMVCLRGRLMAIFVIRTPGSPFRSLPHPLLTATSLAVVAAAVALPFTPIGAWFDLVPLPMGFMLALAAMTEVPILRAGLPVTKYIASRPRKGRRPGRRERW